MRKSNYKLGATAVEQYTIVRLQHAAAVSETPSVYGVLVSFLKRQRVGSAFVPNSCVESQRASGKIIVKLAVDHQP